MTTISHKNLSGAQLHENKGVSAASDGQVATASGGATVWQKLTATNLTGSGNSFGAQLLHCREEQTAGSNQAAAGAVGGWATSTLNTTKTNEISGASRASNIITLPAGTYRVQAFMACAAYVYRKLRLWNNTSSATLVVGMGTTVSGTGAASLGSSTSAQLFGTFTLAGTTNVVLQQYNTSTNVVGSTSTGEVEVYTELMIWKIT